MSERMIAVCGLDCSGCPLLKASLGDLKAAEHLAEWWHAAGWLDDDKGPRTSLPAARTAWAAAATAPSIGLRNAGSSSAPLTSKGWTRATSATISRASGSSSGLPKTKDTPKP